MKPRLALGLFVSLVAIATAVLVAQDVKASDAVATNGIPPTVSMQACGW